MFVTRYYMIYFQIFLFNFLSLFFRSITNGPIVDTTLPIKLPPRYRLETRQGCYVDARHVVYVCFM